MEEYKDIVDYPNYEVSNFGNVRNKRNGRILKPWLGGAGYLYVWISNDSKKKFVIHRLVALAFNQNENNNLTVDHIDRNKLNNRSDNLRWISPKTQSLNTDRHINNSPKVRYGKTISYRVSIQGNNLKFCKCFKSKEEADAYMDECKAKISNVEI